MSASEKLKALDEAIIDLSPVADGRFVSELHVKEPSAQSLVALRNALPQIMAVVEAAEINIAGIEFHQLALSHGEHVLLVALDALDEALKTDEELGGDPINDEIGGFS